MNRCPNCNSYLTFLSKKDRKGSSFDCHECGKQWLDTEEKSEPGEQDTYAECPNCAEGDNRFIYKCNDCGAIGCYDGVFENGCFQKENSDIGCMSCSSINYVEIGIVGNGSAEA